MIFSATSDVHTLFSAMTNQFQRCLSTLLKSPSWIMALKRATLLVCIQLFLSITFSFIPSCAYENIPDIIGVVKEDEGIQEIVSRASGKPVCIGLLQLLSI
jgi:hypothetical protein